MTRAAPVVGGGSGMGAGAARQLHADGYQIGILSSPGKGEALAKELGGIGVTGSHRSNNEMQGIVLKSILAVICIGMLVNSAGHGPRDEINAVRAAALVTPAMAAQKQGTIINFSTFAAFEPDPVCPISAVFRAGLAAHTKLFADKHSADNVRMNNILPGFIDSLAEKDEVRDRIPMPRYGRVDEIAATISFPASAGGGYITGQNIRVDGGITRSV
ncbi:SDR family oxidoreductase [Sedimentitalea sp. HM32M-2]|uniref:SDR family oxidoreductase n=1 Tax=Sedimentitalea sp. HM32M-2 TaxID=3351566 RepID=UPI00362922E5